jgi:hypothetical protein
MNMNKEWATPWGSGKVEQHEAKKDAKPIVYLFVNGAAIGVSAYPSDHEDADKYTMEVQEFLGGRKTTADISITVLRNILAQAGVHVVME